VCQKSGEISLLRQQLAQLQSELSQKAGEVVVLKAQLREARSELQAGQMRAQEAQASLRTRSLELEVCENELQRRRSEAELLREKMGHLEDETARLCHALTNQGVARSQGSQGQSCGGWGAAGRGGPSPSGGREAETWGGDSDEVKAERQNTEALLGLRQQVERLKAELIYERRSEEEQRSGFEDERRVWQEEKEKVIRYQKQLQQNYIQMYRRNRDMEAALRELSLDLGAQDLEAQDLGARDLGARDGDYEVHNGSSDIHFEEITATEI
ncbi:hypothetical protein CRUP_022649, partial [Coryphaenoides rupestris]